MALTIQFINELNACSDFHVPVSGDSEPADGRRVGAADVRHVAGGRRSRGRDLSVTGR